jgi:hypothetical protein
MPDEDPPIEAAMLRAFLAARDVPCPGCGYNVRDLPGDVCPECGERLRLHFTLVDPRKGAQITGLVGLAAGAGFGGLLLLFFGATLVIDRSDMSDEEARIVAILAAGLVVHAAALAAWIRHWARIRRLSPSARRMLVIACWALPLAFVTAFTAMVN